MNRKQLEAQFEILKNDVSGLIDTSYMDRLERTDGFYYLASPKKIQDNKDRVSRIVGAIYCHFEDGDSFVRNSIEISPGYTLPDSLVNVADIISKEVKTCVTSSLLIRDFLLLLRMDGILDFGKTPLCADEDPVEFLGTLIEQSNVTYKDTLYAYWKAYIRGTGSAFISDDPDETPSEKLNKAIMLLTLLSVEDIIGYRDEIYYIEYSGPFSYFGLNNGAAKVLPLIMMGCPKALELFSKARIYDQWDSRADKIANSFSRELESSSLEPIAFDHSSYRMMLEQCTRSGISISGWMENFTGCMDGDNSHVRNWLLEHIDSKVADLIMNKEGYYLLCLSGKEIKDFESGAEYADFRKYIVSNGFLKDIWHNYNEDFGSEYAFYEINSTEEDKKTGFVRFLNFNYQDDNGISLGNLLFDFNPEADKHVYSFISVGKIAVENYDLDMDLYHSWNYVQCKNPVSLKDILTPVEGTVVNFEERPLVINSYFGEPDPAWEKGSINVKLCEDSLDNYGEFIHVDSSAYTYRRNGDMKFITDSALFVRNEWPMKPTWISCKDLGTDGGLIVSGPDADKVRAYKVNEAVVFPWYIAHKLSKETFQFNLRKNENGILDEDQLMRMYIDLPSLQEQKKEIENIINEEIERKKRQIGAAETLFNLSHTVGLPANRIQSLLGNLQDMLADDPEVFCQLKKIGDNFDYIIRVIDSTGKLSGSTCNLEKLRILNLLEEYISSFTSLPFCFDPRIDKKNVDSGIKVNIDRGLFEIALDNILRNAHRHGFDKKSSMDNKLTIALESVQYAGQDYLMLSFCNNGKKLEDKFSIYDYISRGKFGEETGNTGQGGYDIYQIVKKFNGHLGIRANDEWNFILDILLPIADDKPDMCLKTYNYGTLV